MSLTFRAGNTHFGFINLKLYEDCLGHLGGDFITALSNGNKMWATYGNLDFLIVTLTKSEETDKINCNNICFNPMYYVIIIPSFNQYIKNNEIFYITFPILGFRNQVWYRTFQFRLATFLLCNGHIAQL